jgi:protein tyrosine phosphatase (PTP) superfamily phosphohydrolase (DUF442 family)
MPIPAIINYYQIGDRIATSGQPSKADFDRIAASGYEVMINLALPSSDGKDNELIVLLIILT